MGYMKNLVFHFFENQAQLCQRMFAFWYWMTMGGLIKKQTIQWFSRVRFLIDLVNFGFVVLVVLWFLLMVL